MFAAWGHLVYRFRWAILILSAALMALSVVVSASGGDLKSGGIIETSESGRAAKLIRDELPRSNSTSFTLLFSSSTLSSNDPAFKDAVTRALATVGQDPRVLSVLTAYDPGPQAASMFSKDQHSLIAVVSVKDDPAIDAKKIYP